MTALETNGEVSRNISSQRHNNNPQDQKPLVLWKCVPQEIFEDILDLKGMHVILKID